MNGSKEVVLFVVEHIIRHGHTGSHQFGNTSLNEFLRELGILQLVTDSHALAGTYQFGQVGIEGMMGESRHLGIRLAVSPVVTTSERDTQNPTGLYRVIAIGLVEVATTKQ